MRSCLLIAILTPALAGAQNPLPAEDAARIADEGVQVRLADIGGFRGAQGNVIMGYGLVVGLDGTGDSRSTPFTPKLMANALSRWGTMVNPDDFKAKNIAAVSITCQLPAFSAPGRKVGITVQSIGDAKTLQGGFLLPSPLGPVSKPEDVYVLATGPISIGGFSAGANGSGVQKNHQNVGRVPNGGDVLKTVRTEFVFEGRTVYFDLDDPDFSTAQSAASTIPLLLPGSAARAVDAATIQITLPEGMSPVDGLSRIESMEVLARLPASVVINERTGTLVIGGNVKLGPAVIAHGGLRVEIVTDPIISQPPSLSQGQTTTAAVSGVSAEEETAQVGLVSGVTTLNDLAKLLQALKVSSRDMIAIFQALAEQGALKARIEIQ
jgi:flagellar P-ring protein precursor FlgI